MTIGSFSKVNKNPSLLLPMYKNGQPLVVSPRNTPMNPSSYGTTALL